VSIPDALEALLARRRSAEHAKRASLAQAQARLEKAERHLGRLENDFLRARGEIDRTGAAPAAHFERAVAAARSAVLLCRTETEELRNHALVAIREREAAEALKTRRMAEWSAREDRKEERELEEADGNRTTSST
jgi:flagellar biosynthesis chaperone FliJ